MLILTDNDSPMAKKKAKAKKAQQPPVPAVSSGGGTLEGQMDLVAGQLANLQLQLYQPYPAYPVPPTSPVPGVNIREIWDAYFGRGELADFQRLCADLQVQGNLSSKTKCRNVGPPWLTIQGVFELTRTKALGRVHVNIPQFLHAVSTGAPVIFFKNVHQLTKYTLKSNDRIFPKRNVPKGSPLRKLLRMMH